MEQIGFRLATKSANRVGASDGEQRRARLVGGGGEELSMEMTTMTEIRSKTRIGNLRFPERKQCLELYQCWRLTNSRSFSRIFKKVKSLEIMLGVGEETPDKDPVGKLFKSKRCFFTAKELSSCITASERTRVFCSILIALLVVLSYINYPLLGINM
ncbi:hypothetical protein AKJ16_DCAP21381 [Drosera capensis]